MPHVISFPSVARPRPLPCAIAFHCSAASGGEWRPLGDALGGRFALMAPNMIGTREGGPWTGATKFRLAHETAPYRKLLDARREPVHLVGHSYGGGVALRLAAERPEYVASLTLYEPTAFHVLKEMEGSGHTALEEILSLAGDVEWGLCTGDYRAAAERFVDYWGGSGTWDTLRPSVQAEVMAYIPKASLDFRALIDEPTPVADYAQFDFPVMLVKGSATPAPTRQIARRLAAAIPGAASRTVEGAGHMGPVTHAAAVAGIVAAHMRSAEARRTSLAA